MSAGRWVSSEDEDIPGIDQVGELGDDEGGAELDGEEENELGAEEDLDDAAHAFEEADQGEAAARARELDARVEEAFGPPPEREHPQGFSPDNTYDAATAAAIAARTAEVAAEQQRVPIGISQNREPVRPATDEQYQEIEDAVWRALEPEPERPMIRTEGRTVARVSVRAPSPAQTLARAPQAKQEPSDSGNGVAVVVGLFVGGTLGVGIGYLLGKRRGA